jgi:hypothetical protein
MPNWFPIKNFTIGRQSINLFAAEGEVIETDLRSDTIISGAGYVTNNTASHSLQGQSRITSKIVHTRTLFIRDESGMESAFTFESDLPVRTGHRVRIYSVSAGSFDKTLFAFENASTGTLDVLLSKANENKLMKFNALASGWEAPWFLFIIIGFALPPAIFVILPWFINMRREVSQARKRLRAEFEEAVASLNNSARFEK